MNLKEAKEKINGLDPFYLTKAKHGGYVCPVCGNGSGKDGTGITKKKGDTHYKCFGSCGLYADNLELIMKYYNLKDFIEAIKKGCELYGITLDPSPIYDQEKPADTKEVKAVELEADPVEVEADYTDDLKRWYEAIQVEGNAGLQYLQGRGISKELIDRFRIGYCENWKHPEVVKEYPNIPASPRVIIPTSRHSYLARDTRKDIPEKAKKWAKSKAGSVRIFNLKAVEDTEKPVFIVEGEIDALSIIEAGGQAVALGSTSYTQRFLDGIQGKRITQPFILALDNDTAGTEATDILTMAFKERGIKYYRLNPCGSYNDANEALTASRATFTDTVQQITADPAKWEYMRTNAQNYISSFLDEVDENANTPGTPTGYRIFDTLLDGGLFEGLYILGALTSLGKTTFIHQMADQIAQRGHDVLYMSLEMSRYELMAKSISRHTMLIEHDRGGDLSNAKTTRGIMNGAKWKNYSPAEHELIGQALEEYNKYSKHLYVYEGVGNIGVEKIAELTQRHIDITGNKPVIIIDYLQILQPYDVRMTDKQNTDKNVLELKRLSRDNKVAVVAISSLNRASYTEEVSMRSFKESGAIEYGSDVLLGLQFEGAGTDGFNSKAVDEAFEQNPRNIELKIIKNRNGARPNRAIKCEFYPMFNYFKEIKHGGGNRTTPKRKGDKKKWDQLALLQE